MLTKTKRIQILGSTTSLLGAWPRGDAPIHVCIVYLTDSQGSTKKG